MTDRSYSDYCDSLIAADTYGDMRGVWTMRTHCAACGRTLPQGPWRMPWYALAFCTTQCAIAWEGGASASDF